MKILNKISAVICMLLLSTNVALTAEKWDMALAYGASNFHSANATEFAKNVSDKSGGKLTIVLIQVVHFTKVEKSLELCEQGKLK